MLLSAARCLVRRIGLHHFANLQTVDVVRTIARRHSEPWRLVGLSIRSSGTEEPTLEAFAKGRFDGLSDAKVVELYREPFQTGCKTARSHCLCERQFALLQRLAGAAAHCP